MQILKHPQLAKRVFHYSLLEVSATKLLPLAMVGGNPHPLSTGGPLLNHRPWGNLCHGTSETVPVVLGGFGRLHKDPTVDAGASHVLGVVDLGCDVLIQGSLPVPKAPAPGLGSTM